MSDRWIDLDGLVNMRDVGGLPTRDGGSIAPRRLIRSDNLQDLTEGDVRRLVVELGVTDVVDLRTDSELRLEGPGPLRRLSTLPHHHHSLIEERLPSEPSGKWRRGPWSRARRTARCATRAFWAEHYLGYLAKPARLRRRGARGRRRAPRAPPSSTARRARTAPAPSSRWPSTSRGVPREEIVADYVLTGERLERIIGRLMPRESYARPLAKQKLEDQLPRAESIEAILTAVDEGWGGAAGWLRAHGLERGRRRAPPHPPHPLTHSAGNPTSRAGGESSWPAKRAASLT